MFENLLIILLATSGLSIPTVDNALIRHTLDSIDDAGRAGGAEVGLWIAPNGIVAVCEIHRSAGEQSIIEQICPALEGYQMSVPTDTGGSAIYAEISYQIFVTPGEWGPSRRDRLRNELMQQVRASSEEFYIEPTSFEWQTGWSLLLQIDETGTTAGCAPSTSRVDIEAATQACSSVAARSFPVRLGSDGEPTSYIRRLFARPS